MDDVDITPHQTIPDPDYAQNSGHSGRLAHHGHDHHQRQPMLSRAGSHIKPRDCPSREATGGELSETTPNTPDGVNANTSSCTSAVAQSPPQHKMLFSDLYKNPKSPLSKLRQSLPHPVPALPPGLDEDLVSRDKVKQKEAVKRFLAERVRNDWEFNWPASQKAQHAEQPQPPEVTRVSSDGASTGSVSKSCQPVESSDKFVDPAAVEAAADAAPASVPAPDVGMAPIPTSPTPETEVVPKDPGEEADLESDAESIYSTVSEDALHYRPRADWSSDLSDDDGAQPSKPVLSPFRFDTPDSVGVAVRTSLYARRARRRREVREESIWNNGLACYNARRDAWTGARTVRVKPRATPVTSPVSPISPRRLFWRTHSRTESASSTVGGAPLTTVLSAPAATTAHTTPLSPTTTHASNHSSTLSSEDAPPCARHLSSTSTTAPSPYPVETLLPIAPPLIPPQNPMRASITPQIYPSLYDKVVVHSLQPSCPVNLSDMVASCVAGWKRDGEWPPRSAPPPPPPQPSVVAVRRKRSEAARKGSAASNGEKGRRLSFSFLKGVVEGKEQQQHNEKEGVKGEEECGGAGAGGKGIRRSLQKVFSGLGHHHGEDEHVQGKETAVM